MYPDKYILKQYNIGKAMAIGADIMTFYVIQGYSLMMGKTIPSAKNPHR